MSFRDQTRTESAKSVDLLRCLDCFLQVAETRNMTATARIMRLTQSAVSQQIQAAPSNMEQAGAAILGLGPGGRV